MDHVQHEQTDEASLGSTSVLEELEAEYSKVKESGAEQETEEQHDGTERRMSSDYGIYSREESVHESRSSSSDTSGIDEGMLKRTHELLEDARRTNFVLTRQVACDQSVLDDLQDDFSKLGTFCPGDLAANEEAKQESVPPSKDQQDEAEQQMSGDNDIFAREESVQKKGKSSISSMEEDTGQYKVSPKAKERWIRALGLVTWTLMKSYGIRRSSISSSPFAPPTTTSRKKHTPVFAWFAKLFYAISRRYSPLHIITCKLCTSHESPYISANVDN